jgi:formylglycine-generating enzyme
MAGQNTHLTKGKKGIKTYQSKKKKNNKKYVASLEDGILLPDYRIPTEAEWEYAAKGNVGETEFDNINQDKVYPWSDYTLRMKEGKEKDRGKFMLNVMRGKGDYMGVAGGQLNDAGEITTPVYSYWPNSFGIYNMGGNVSEWVNDIYRPLSIEDMDDFMPFRGNVFKVAQLDEYGEGFADKDSLGRLRYIDVTKDMNVNRRNYKVADNIGFKDELNYNSNEMMYEYGVTSLINNQARVYKGGSWADRAYWAAPGTRRYLDENLSMSTLGFRCCMTRVGSPAGNGKKRYNGLPSAGGNKKTRQKKKN